MINRDLWEAHAALAGPLKENRSLDATVALRLALNRNAIRPIQGALDEIRIKLLQEHKADSASLVGLALPEAQGRITSFGLAWREVLGRPVDQQWKAVAEIEAREFGGCQGVAAEDLAPLLVVGVVINPAGLLAKPAAAAGA